MWFRLLDVVMKPQKDSLDRLDLKELTSSLLNAMMGYVSPHSILSKVMSDPAYNLSDFKEMRRFIRAMIDTYNFEQTMLTTTNNLINCDLTSRLADLKRLANRAVVSSSVMCTFCMRPFATADTREVRASAVFSVLESPTSCSQVFCPNDASTLPEEVPRLEVCVRAVAEWQIN